MQDVLTVPRRQAVRWRRYAGLAVVVASFSSILIVGSYWKLNHTWDEPTHIAAGMEALQLHRYTLQTENPPLSRIPFALLPYFSGMRIDPQDSRALPSGVNMLYGSGSYIRNVAKARVANLLIFWLTLAMTWLLSGGRSNPKVAALATCLVATLPSIVAHSGLATTDMPFVLAFLLALWRWKATLIEPSIPNAAWLGLSVGIALAAKFSTIPFLPPVAVALMVAYWWTGQLPSAWRSPSRLVRCAAVAILGSAITIWASYGFRIGTLGELPRVFAGYGSMPTTGWIASIQDVRLPAHEFWHGLLFLQAHTKAGHPSYMLGQNSRRGFWLYYPVMLLVKTPLATLALFVVGWALAIRRTERPEFIGYALGALGLLLAAATSPINLGIRHVLAVYPLLCMVAAYGVMIAVEQMPSRAAAIAAVAIAVVTVQAAVLAMSFPRQLSYYNVIAAGQPDYFLSDSDFEWGQDVLAMEAYLHEHPVSELYVAPNGSALFCRHDLPPLKVLPVDHQVNGWIAVFQRVYQLNGPAAGLRKDLCLPTGGTNALATHQGWLDWLHQRKPVAVIGSGVLLFHVTDAAGT